ncbi:phosphotransferase enzyme family protein [Streptomyces griseoaurantiacus]|uniref:phosphotransferase enzyme family protein n=1 Tax=Streptomyces griseoaurantiacus TaxID=68213 RepID=UPI0038215ED5
MAEQMVTAVAGTLTLAYGVHPAEVAQIPVGTATWNYRVTTRSGRQYFAKVYLDRASMAREREAVELAAFARSGGVPVPAVHPTREGDLVEVVGRLPMSLWEFVADAETAESGLTGARWPAVGTMLGRLHRHLATHPAAEPRLRAGAEVCDLKRARARFERLIGEYGRHDDLSPFEEWAMDAARQRLALLDRVAVVLDGLPALTEQVVHGDLSALNLLLRGDEVAAVVDFQPPRPRYLAWEVARIGCDPRTVLLGDEWLTGLPELLAAYRDEHPHVHVDDLLCCVAVGCAYTLASTYPLAEPLDAPASVDASLKAYGKARHESALVLLNRLTEVKEVLNDALL